MTKKAAAQVVRDFGRSGLSLKDPKATKWLATNLSKIKTGMRQSSFIDSSRTITKRNQLSPGRMVFYAYDPKTQDELPFWDAFPVVIILHPKPKGFLGLNLHYIPPSVRATFLNNLIKLVDDPNWAVYNNYKALIRVTYPILKATKKLKPYRPCIKRYLYSHIISDIAFISSAEWKTVPFFPMDDFQGATREQVWKLAK
jgi:hypothetical protein